MMSTRSTAEATLLFAGLALAGSEGPWFPWINLAGMAAFCAFAALASRRAGGRA
ncbi:MAG: hypothetical protein IH614_13685 [Desulfuromonadales bacterium]|nr:hypothetical protein [Desulfuromonadales bacterium]